MDIVEVQSDSRLLRREELRKLEPGQRNACEPLAKPRDEPGILWDAFRDEASPA